VKLRAPLSPTQSAAFAMGRALLVFDTWYRQAGVPLDAERAMLIDFAAQHPRSIVGLAPSVLQVVRAHGLQKSDLADLFAQRHFGSMREGFLDMVVDLVSRDLLVEAGADKGDVAFAPTDAGHAAAVRFSSPLAIGLRALCSVLCDEWRRKNVRDLAGDIRKTLPDESRMAASLGEPFAPWLSEVD
jgi:hypothetical protein